MHGNAIIFITLITYNKVRWFSFVKESVSPQDNC